jgi:predicted O-methyltransferase YrrM
MRLLPPRVALFHWRARRRASAIGDVFSLTSATRAEDLSRLLKLAANRRSVAELGTATGWTAISLALSDRGRQVITHDPVRHPERSAYLELVSPDVRARITWADAAGRSGPPPGLEVELLYIDSSHTRDETIAELEAWRDALVPGALVVLDDYLHPDYSGVREAIEALALDGRAVGTMYVHQVGPPRPQIGT